LVDRVGEYLENAMADNTRRAYASDWADFAAWCAARGRAALPAAPETLALYLAALGERAKLSTVTRRMSAIRWQHREAHVDCATAHAGVGDLLAGLRRTKRVAPRRKKALLVEELRALVENLPANLLGLRDRALLLLGFSGALRRSELVALDCEDLGRNEQGLVLTIRQSKTDQAGEGRPVGIPRGTGASCPVAAVEAWRAAAGIASGALFRRVDRHGRLLGARLSAQAVGLVLQHRLAERGIDAAEYGGHSLRAGLATSAARAGKSERAIQQQTGHRSLTILRRYIRDGNLFRENAAAGLGL